MNAFVNPFSPSPIRINPSDPSDLSSPDLPTSLPASDSPRPRPQLRIITSPPPPNIRPIPIIKSAPLLIPTFITTNNPQSRSKSPNREPAIIATEGLTVHVFSPPAPPSYLPIPTQKRRLSIRLRSLFSHLHIRTSRQEKEEGTPTPEALAPDRPHRSPGTASFVVTRHQAPDIPVSARSGSSSRLSMMGSVRRNSALAVPKSAALSGSVARRASQGQGHLIPLEMEISHFSTPITMWSSSSSAAVGFVGSRLPGQQGSGTVEKGTRGRKAGSMPDLRAFQSAW